MNRRIGRKIMGRKILPSIFLPIIFLPMSSRQPPNHTGKRMGAGECFPFIRLPPFVCHFS